MLIQNPSGKMNQRERILKMSSHWIAIFAVKAETCSEDVGIIFGGGQAWSDALGVFQRNRRERILSDLGQQFQMCMEK